MSGLANFEVYTLPRYEILQIKQVLAAMPSTFEMACKMLLRISVRNHTILFLDINICTTCQLCDKLVEIELNDGFTKSYQKSSRIVTNVAFVVVA